MAYRRPLKVSDIYGSGSDDSDSDSEEYDYNRHGDVSDGLLSENGDTDLGTTTLRTQQSVAQDTQRVATSVSTSVLPSSGDIRHPGGFTLSSASSTSNSRATSAYQSSSRESEQTARTDMDMQELILQQLQKANSRLDEFAINLQAIERRLSSVEDIHANVTSSSPPSSNEESDKTERTKVSQEVREMYRSLLENSQEFAGFDTQKRFEDSSNQAVVTVLFKEAERLNLKMSLFQIRAAAKRFYQTKCEEKYLKVNGKYEQKIIDQRRRNRINRKLESRRAAFANSSSSLTDTQINLWKKVLTKEFMSSEESEEEDAADHADGNKRAVLAIKPLAWRAPKVDRFFKRLDHKTTKRKSKQSKQQMLPRVIGRQSSRARPLCLPDDFFGFAAP